jgi:hypothetical protein
MLLAVSHNGSNWRGALPRQENELECLRKALSRFYLHWVVMYLLNGSLPRQEIEFDRLQKLRFDFIYTKSLWHLLNGSSSMLRERTWSFTKDFQSILLAQSRYDIYWKGALQRQEIELDRSGKDTVDLSGTEKWWLLLKERSSKIREGTWAFTNTTRTILFSGYHDDIYWNGALTW